MHRLTLPPLHKSKASNIGTVWPSRSSKRNASSSEQDSLEKASKLKALKNLDSPSVKGPFQENTLAPSMGKTAAA